MLDPQQLLDDRVLSGNGSPRLCFAVGGVEIRLVSGADAPLLATDEAHERFLVPSAANPLDITVGWGDLSAVRRGEACFDTGGSWALRRLGGKLAFDLYSTQCGEAPYRTAVVAEDGSAGEILLRRDCHTPEDAVDAIRFPLAELLVNLRLAREGGVELHACGVVDEAGRGILFAGNSGDGKTTTARLWSGLPGVTILSDDRIIVREEDDGFRMYGTPWHGEGQFAVNDDARVAAVFLLEHGYETTARPLAAAGAVAGLFPRCFPPFYDREGVEMNLATLEKLAGSVPCFAFPFAPDGTAVEFARRTIEGLPA